MFRKFAIFTVWAAGLPAFAAPEPTPLRRSITSILALQSKLADARAACDAALAADGDPAAAGQDQAMLFTICGDLALTAGELEKSRALLESALELWQRLFGPVHGQVASTTLDLAIVHRRAGRYELSLQHARRALQICESNQPDSVTLPRILTNVAAAEIMLGRYADAESNLNRVLALLARYSLEGSPEAATAHATIGLLHFKQGHFFDAERSYNRAAAGFRGPDAARNLANLARVYLAIKRYDKAETACARAVHMMTGLVGENHAEVGAMIEVLAQVRTAQKRHSEAAELLTQALEITIRADGPDHRNESMILNSIGVSYSLAGRHPEAEAYFRKAVRIQEQLGGHARIEFSATLHNLAVACSKQGRQGEALEFASRAFAIREADLPNVDNTLLEIMLHKAQLLRKLHHRAEAVKLEQMAREARAGTHNQDPHQWMVDFRELQRGK